MKLFADFKPLLNKLKLWELGSVIWVDWFWDMGSRIAKILNLPTSFHQKWLTLGKEPTEYFFHNIFSYLKKNYCTKYILPATILLVASFPEATLYTTFFLSFVVL